MSKKIIRTICFFTSAPGDHTIEKLNELKSRAENYDFEVQTLRISTSKENLTKLANMPNKDVLTSIGTVDLPFLNRNLDEFLTTTNPVNANIELAHTHVVMSHVDLLFEIFNRQAHKSFNFSFVFNNRNNSPFMPSSHYQEDGFSLGLQPTNLSKDCNQINEWLANVSTTWNEIDNIFSAYGNFLGIDGSIAPLGSDEGSLISFLERIGVDYNNSFTSTTYRQITEFIHANNPRPIGLNGLMMPALEDFTLAEKYEQGGFDIERNIFVSLHCGLGIDVYPIGLDQNRGRVLEILRLVQSLSNKFNKPLSVRFVSDGKSNIGDKSDYQNKYLKDVIIRAL